MAEGKQKATMVVSFGSVFVDTIAPFIEDLGFRLVAKRMMLADMKKSGVTLVTDMMESESLSGRYPAHEMESLFGYLRRMKIPTALTGQSDSEYTVDSLIKEVEKGLNSLIAPLWHNWGQSFISDTDSGKPK